MAISFPLSAFVITISLFFPRFFVRRDVDVVYTWRRFVVVKVRISKIREMRFYLAFAFLGFKFVKKRTMNHFKGSEYFGFSNFMRLD